jgi:hypothetical protein
LRPTKGADDPVAAPWRSCLFLAIWIAAPVSVFLVKADTFWATRYVAVIWPAFALALCALLGRLPTAPVRAYAVVLLLAVNVAQCVARLVLVTEPPIDWMVADLRTSQTSGGRRTLAVFPDAPPHSYGYTGGTLDGHVGKYYYAIAAGPIFTPRESYDLPLSARVDFPTASEFSPIFAQVRDDPALRSLIVWEQLPPNAPLATPDTTAERLGPGWRLSDERTFEIWQQWVWSHEYSLRRRQYTRE